MNETPAERERSRAARGRYKEIVAGLAAAAGACASATGSAPGAGAAARRPRGPDAARGGAGRALPVRRGAAWEAALEVLWAESWLKLRRGRGRIRAAIPPVLDELDAEVEQRAAELHEAVRRRLWPL